MSVSLDPFNTDEILDEPQTSPFMIHFQTAVYANELYDTRGRSVFTLREAIDAAEELYGETGWEVYNGRYGENRYVESLGEESA